MNKDKRLKHPREEVRKVSITITSTTREMLRKLPGTSKLECYDEKIQRLLRFYKSENRIMDI